MLGASVLYYILPDAPRSLNYAGAHRGLVPSFANMDIEEISGSTAGDPRFMLGPTGLVHTPFGMKGESIISLAVRDALAGGAPYITGDNFSIVIPTRNEAEFIVRTIRYTLEADKYDQLINEIIIVDDFSDEMMAKVIDKGLTKKEKTFVRVIRFDEPQGLIRAKIAGADASTSENIFFLDGHCRPKMSFLGPILQELKMNYKRIVTPIIEDIHHETWEDNGTHGAKMMFDWTFEFGWIEDTNRDVPVLAGGILGITKKWWEESGKYDPGMLEWGGENLEQSFRVWLCGGEITVNENSKVGHIFNRPPKPNPENKLVRQVQTNQKRCGKVWLDNYYKYLERFHPIIKTLDEGNIEERVALRTALKCKPFQWYVDRFQLAFESKGLLLERYHQLQHKPSNFCMTVEGEDVVVRPCHPDDGDQLWSIVGGGRAIQNLKTNKCLSTVTIPKEGQATVSRIAECKWPGLFQGILNSIFYQFDSEGTGKIFNPNNGDPRTESGSEKMKLETDLLGDPKTLCLASSLKDGEEDPHGNRVLVERCVRGAPEHQWRWHILPSKLES